MSFSGKSGSVGQPVPPGPHKCLIPGNLTIRQWDRSVPLSEAGPRPANNRLQAGPASISGFQPPVAVHRSRKNGQAWQ
jgi:hypothetical protein